MSQKTDEFAKMCKEKIENGEETFGPEEFKKGEIDSQSCRVCTLTAVSLKGTGFHTEPWERREDNA